MTIVVLVVLVGLIVGVGIELLLSKRQRARKAGPLFTDPETFAPGPPRLPEPRFIEDGEGFTIIGPVEYDDPGETPEESGDSSRPGDRD